LATRTRKDFPRGFLWGASTAAHQVEGNNTASDLWLAESVTPTLFAERSGDAVNSFNLWPRDLDIVHDLHLNAYRFSIEWARIEPEPGLFSVAMLDHYKRIIEGCRERGLAPVVTFNHFTLPRWVAARGGWTSPDTPNLFASYCDRAARHLAEGMAYAATLNEPNMVRVIGDVLPPEFSAAVGAMNQAAGRACGAEIFKNGMIPEPADIDRVETNLLAAHQAGRAAIKAARSSLGVGVTLTVSDDQAVGDNSVRDAKRARYYGAWLEAARGDDFIGVQNYARARYNESGMLPPPEGAQLNAMGTEICAPSLAGAVRYVHEATGLPIFVTEHGLNTHEDAQRAEFIPASLSALHDEIARGAHVLGYMHWSLLDNFEWVFGYQHTFGLCAVDRTTFVRTPKPSAAILARIARANAV
jgi:beta-glucosidase